MVEKGVPYTLGEVKALIASDSLFEYQYERELMDWALARIDELEAELETRNRYLKSIKYNASMALREQ